MRPRIVLPTAVLALGLTVLLAGTAAAAVTIQLGRQEVEVFHFENPNLGWAHNVVQGELVTSGVADDEILRGADRITKISNVVRVQVDKVTLQQFRDGAWRNVISTSAVVNSGTGPGALSKSPFVKLCANGEQRYRVVANLSARWTDGFLSRFARTSSEFTTLPNVQTLGSACLA
jgi:hypothetical protein